jgi:hypothetical protein
MFALIGGKLKNLHMTLKQNNHSKEQKGIQNVTQADGCA